MTRVVGYARVSTDEQNVEIQVSALRAAGAERIFKDEGVSGKHASRPALDRCLRSLKTGDTLVVWKLDRLGRSIKNLIEIVNGLKERGVEFRSLTEGFDTSTAQGRLFFHIVGSMAEYERELIVERTHAGLAAAKRRGAKLGRPFAISPAQFAGAKTMLSNGMSVPAAARALGVSHVTLYRALERAVV